MLKPVFCVLLLLQACGSDASTTGAVPSGGSGGSAGQSGSGNATAGTGGASGSGTAGNGTAGNGAAGSGTAGSGTAGGQSFGDPHSGNFWLGPVDYAETQWHNACAPSNKYPAGIQQLYGTNIMGLSNQMVALGLNAGAGQLCDVCAELSANGKTLTAHVVTYGDETGPNDIDVSPEIYATLDGNAGHTLDWHFVSCPTTAPIQYTFDGRQWTNVYFFRVWVRNAKVPVNKLEYRVGNGAWATADWQSDGAWQASSQDFSGGFSLRLTSIDNQMLEDTLPGLNTFDPDVGISSTSNFQ